MKKRTHFFQTFLLICTCGLMINGCGVWRNSSKETQQAEQTQVENAEIWVDENGIPVMDIKNIGEIRHPAWIGIYALQYGGYESFYETETEIDQKKFDNCINWLKENLEELCNGCQAWLYTFDSTYNDVSIEAPWYSAFGQAVPIEALVEHYHQTGDEESLLAAQKAAEILFVDVEDGGLLFQSGEDIWFEEIPSRKNPPHILNGHMRVLIALQKLYDATGDATYLEWYKKGAATLERWLPRYDTGYWLRYDLNPKKQELLFRLNNKYGYQLEPLAIDTIGLTDLVSGESVWIDVGAETDAFNEEEGSGIAGNDWGQAEELEGRTVRKLMETVPATSGEEQDGSMQQPYTYFYLNLPGEWTDHLRTDWFELTIVYKDENPGNMNVQMRSIAPGDAFVDLKDGDLLLTGSGEWREWKIPVRTTDLGWWTGGVYAEKHMQYLDWLDDYTPELHIWTKTARGYLNGEILPENYEILEKEQTEMLEQVPPVPVYSLDEKGVVRQHIASEKTIFTNGIWDKSSGGGIPVYSPYIVAAQALGEFSNWAIYNLKENMYFDPEKWGGYDWVYPDEVERIRPENAYIWLYENAYEVGDSLLWAFNYKNCYNDLVQEDGWVSAFSQRYIIDAFIKLGDEETALKAGYAYGYGTGEGGLNSVSKEGNIWYEEVPNNSHILNAHLASLVALEKINQRWPDKKIEQLYEKGISSLVENLYRFDTGYWTKYDMNPKKNLFLQFDWKGDGVSPMFDTIRLYDPVTNTATEIDVGEAGDFDSSVSYLSGMEWMTEQIVDGRSVRQFANGYSVHGERVSGGTRHNAYVNILLPQTEQEDYFNIQMHKLILVYKDTAKGELKINSQSINEGDYLQFSEIPGSVVECVGDNQWKTAVIDVRPQDMGWYMGEDYQAYHNEQLELIAGKTQHWLLKQYLEKWEYYLESYQNQQDVIVKDKITEYADISSELQILDSGSTYEGFGLENSLDGDSGDDYTAFVEVPEEQYFLLGLEQSAEIEEIQIEFESEDNFAEDYEIIFYLDGEEVKRQTVSGQDQRKQFIICDSVVADSFRVAANTFHGQTRLLVRDIKIFGTLHVQQ